MHDAVPRSKNKSVVIREAYATLGSGCVYIDKMTLDTGASNGNYIGRKKIKDFKNHDEIIFEPCSHRVRLGDGKSIMYIKEMVTLNISLLNDYGERCEPIATQFYVCDNLGDEAIIGLPELLGNYFEYFSNVLNLATTKHSMNQTDRIMFELAKITDEFEAELYRKSPNLNILRKLTKKAKLELSKYKISKNNILNDPNMKTVSGNSEKQRIKIETNLRKDVYDITNRMATMSYMPTSTSVILEPTDVLSTLTQTSIPGCNQLQVENDDVVYLVSSKHGVVYEDNRVESIVEAIELSNEHALTCVLNPGEIIFPWRDSPTLCEEEEETPDPLSYNEDIMKFMEMSVPESRKEYFEQLASHVSENMKIACPQIMDLLGKVSSQETFAPSTWDGLKIPAVTFETIGTLPVRMKPGARPIREELFANAKLEFERLRAYFYTDSESPIASPLVIAPKATAPFIRFCGDYRQVNKFIKIPQQPIPIVQHELIKAAKFKVYVDLDMANSFHQIPLDEEFSNILSVQTPWGLVRPKFLPEGVGPASGLLQHIVRDAFEEFKDWTIVIFDNFLILAEDYEDAYKKLARVLDKCTQYGIVLKMKKSFIGVDTVTFFGYEVTNGTWKLSDSRKQAIAEMKFPHNVKTMQSFLGAALFFHHHVTDYSEWSARLYEMTHTKFSWNRTTWTYDYEAHFELFKTAILNATKLHFPNYDLPWVLRCDASQFAVGAVIYQEFILPSGEIEHQPIAFSSKRFSEPAQKWDTYKREAYAIYQAVMSFHYYLRGKEFVVETDHRNLQWIETSQTPIVVRWRALLQSYSFLIRHIPGTENKVADWMSRMYTTDEDIETHQAGNDIKDSGPKDLENTQFVDEHMTNLKLLQLMAQDTDPSLCDPTLCNLCSNTFKLKLEQQQPKQEAIDIFIRNTSRADQLRLLEADVLPEPSVKEFDQIMRENHGGRALHFGAYETWRRAKLDNPEAHISIEAVRNFVRECPMCQKMRNTGIVGLKPVTKTLKPTTYRRRIGMDHVTITPADKSGNTCILLIVEHFSHFPQAYPAKDYTAESVVKALIKHYTTFGMFDEIVSDPGSALMADAVKQLNTYLGIKHVVSLIGRHESNGCESTGAQYLRHLKALCADERIIDRWSEDTVLPLINFAICNHPTPETGGYTPFQMKYGTQDAEYFRMPETLEPGKISHEILIRLDKDLQIIREKSLQLQQELVQERKKNDEAAQTYEPGDYVLFNPREKPSDFLTSKLSPTWLGPYEVISQTKNDVLMRHLCMKTEHVQHLTRLKPFFGSKAEAEKLAMLDYNQFDISSINYYTGNPHVRTSMQFNVTFKYGDVEDTHMINYTPDIANTLQFENYINAHEILMPLRYAANAFQKQITAINRLVITKISPGDICYLDLRYFDDHHNTWFDALNLPDKAKTYIFKIHAGQWDGRGNKKIQVYSRLFDSTYILKPYDVNTLIYREEEFDENLMVKVTEDFGQQYPQIFIE